MKTMNMDEVRDLFIEAFGNMSGDEIAECFNQIRTNTKRLLYLGDSEWMLKDKKK